MIRAALPGFLWAGAAFALLPLALHFVTRRPPDRQPLPTAHFLREDARTLVRLRRTPSDVMLLVIRMAFAFLLGALVWTPCPAVVTGVMLHLVCFHALVREEERVLRIRHGEAFDRYVSAVPRYLPLPGLR